MEKLLLCTILLNLFALEVLTYAPLPKAPNCGKTNLPSLRGRVLNGSFTSLNEFPWLVYLKTEVKVLGKISFQNSTCTSSLITSDWVLTAAHCVYFAKAYEHPEVFALSAKVTLGEWNTLTDPDCNENNECSPKSIQIPIKRIVVHPNYYTKQQEVYAYDIALLRLERSVKFSPYVQPICLPLGSTERSLPSYEGLKVTIAGWGRYSNNVYGSAIKRKAIVTVKDFKPCQEWYGENLELSEKYQLCVGGPDGGACNGDSGGPLLLESTSDKNTYYQIGIASLGRQECINITRPNVYVRVDAFIDWIGETIQ